MLNQQLDVANVMPFEQPTREQSPEELGFRRFVVTNRDALALPGCTEVEEVRLGRAPVPAFELHSVPTDSTHRNFKTLRVHNYMLAQGDDGTPVLLRGLNSNDGKWQIGAEVYVRGEWGEGKSLKT